MHRLASSVSVLHFRDYLHALTVMKMHKLAREVTESEELGELHRSLLEACQFLRLHFHTKASELRSLRENLMPFRRRMENLWHVSMPLSGAFELVEFEDYLKSLHSLTTEIRELEEVRLLTFLA